jgi:amino acid adenylation domain-containing protein
LLEEFRHDFFPVFEHAFSLGLQSMNEQLLVTSFQQQRLCFLDQLEPGTIAYNLPRAMRLSGSLDPATLAKALQFVISRHESIRTIFTFLDGVPKQVVLPDLPFELPMVDLRDLPHAEREQAALRIAGEEARKPFDLSRGPLLRAKLLWLGHDDHLLILVMHHIITDGWSMSVLFKEVGELYASFAAGEKSRLPELPLQYSDFSIWQRQSVTDDFLADQLDYWKKKLQGAETVLQLPTDRPRSAVHSGRGNIVRLELSSQTKENLKALAEGEGSTLFMALLALFQLLLWRYTSQSSILVGTPAAGRNQVELEKLIGFFVNALILRADPAAESSFRQLLRQARANTLEALDHQVPFEKVVEALNPDRTINRNPLFQVMFVFQNFPKQKLELPGLVLQEIELEGGVAKFDLALEIVDLDSLHCTFEYDSDLYDASTIQRMAGHFARLVEGAIAAPDEEIAKLPLLTAAEIRQLAGWNETACDYPHDLSIHAAFDEQAARTPGKTALICEEKRLSYRELNQLANRLARSLMHGGVKPATLVGVSQKRSLEMVIALLAILKTGAAYVPLDPSYPEQRLRFLVEDSQVNFVVTSREFAGLFRKYEISVVEFDLESLSAEEEGTTNTSPALAGENRAYLIYTSGSSGIPKGVEGTHQASMNRFVWMWKTYPFLEGDTCCQKTALGFVDSVWEIFGPLLAGITSVVVPYDTVVDPELLVQLLAKYEVTRIVLVPSLLRVVLDGVEDLQGKLPKLRLWSCSGEVLPADLVKRFAETLPGATLLNIYGCSEVGADVTWHEVTPQDGDPSVPIGRPISNVQIHILDHYMNRVPVGVPGELYVGGDCLARGYWRRPDLDAARFITHQFELDDPIRLFKTGDLARYLPNGEIQYIGRIDSQVKINGILVELGEIEVVLATHPTVRDVVVVLDDRLGQKRLGAYVTVRPGMLPDVDELRRFLKFRLPDYMIPSEYFVVEVFPFLPSGKVDRKALASRTAAHPIEERRYIAPQTPTQESLAMIWRDVLGAGQVGITDNFFERGGHSLTAMRVVARIRQVFDVEIPIRSLFEEPTIKGLANKVEEARATGIRASTPIAPRTKTASLDRKAILTQLDKLSEDELRELLKQALKEKPGVASS